MVSSRLLQVTVSKWCLAPAAASRDVEMSQSWILAFRSIHPSVRKKGYQCVRVVSSVSHLNQLFSCYLSWAGEWRSLVWWCAFLQDCSSSTCATLKSLAKKIGRNFCLLPRNIGCIAWNPRAVTLWYYLLYSIFPTFFYFSGKSPTFHQTGQEPFLTFHVPHSAKRQVSSFPRRKKSWSFLVQTNLQSLHASA